MRKGGPQYRKISLSGCRSFFIKSNPTRTCNSFIFTDANTAGQYGLHSLPFMIIFTDFTLFYWALYYDLQTSWTGKKLFKFSRVLYINSCQSKKDYKKNNVQQRHVILHLITRGHSPSAVRSQMIHIKPAFIQTETSKSFLWGKVSWWAGQNKVYILRCLWKILHKPGVSYLRY